VLHLPTGVLGAAVVVLVSAAGMTASRLRWSARSLGRKGFTPLPKRWTLWSGEVVEPEAERQERVPVAAK
jgi:hypothetical protein